MSKQHTAQVMATGTGLNQIDMPAHGQRYTHQGGHMNARNINQSCQALQQGTMARWWIYQRERFPIFAHGSLIVLFSAAAIGLAHMLAGHTGMPALFALITSFVSTLIFFMLLRILDEFKDNKDDRHYRPYRAVPRGLISLDELGRLGLSLVAIQCALAYLYNPTLLLLLVLIYGYLVLMTCEFFVSTWLKSHPLAYATSHMIIMPLIAIYASAPVWMNDVVGIPDDLICFFVLGFFTGLVIEIGRKVRAPVDEEIGVETYSALWGISHALMLWFAMQLGSAMLALGAAHSIAFVQPLAVLLLILLAINIVVAIRMHQKPTWRTSKLIEKLSGLWTIGIYAGLAITAYTS